MTSAAEPVPIPIAKPAVPVGDAEIGDASEASPDLPLVTAPKTSSILYAKDLYATCGKYMAPKEIEKVKEAYAFANRCHAGQFRKSGEAYIHHPIAVANILATWHLDVQSVEAGLLHDVLEDTATTKEEMALIFSPEIANIVDGVSKLEKIKFATSEEHKAETFKKMLLAMGKDIRVIIVKLADRLHNLRTLGVMRPEKRRRIALETIEIYVPIAHHLGINHLFREMQDLCLENYYPRRYAVLFKALETARRNRKPALEMIQSEIREKLSKAGIPARVLGREKTVFGIYNQMRIKHLPFSEVFDLYGFRTIVPTRDDCYRALGVLHMMYRPVQGRFKDFIAIPKSNGYQGLHTTVIGPLGTPVEIQIRTELMNEIAEEGILLYWKKSGVAQHEIQGITQTWLQSLLDIEQKSTDSSEFYENVKTDLFPDKVYTFTPKGKVISLPKGASALDFAYQIHSDVGNHFNGCRINGQDHDMDRKLHNGDMVEIFTSSLAHPLPSWLYAAKTGKTRAEVKLYLKNLSFDDAVKIGREELEHEAKGQNVVLEDVTLDAWEALLEELRLSSRASVFAQVGHGELSSAIVIHRLSALETEAKDKNISEGRTAIIKNGYKRLALLGRCCHPVRGDQVVLFETKDSEPVLHRKTCPKAVYGAGRNPSAWSPATWVIDPKAKYPVPIVIKAGPERSALRDIAHALSLQQAFIEDMNMSSDSSGETTYSITILVESRTHLIHILKDIRLLKSVVSAQRVMRIV